MVYEEEYEIGISSEEDKGTSVKIILSYTIVGGKVYKLIIVEDEEIIRKSLVHTIDWLSIGFTVIAEIEDR
ncbi:hypothetical protein GCM10008914_01660 [Clostridium tertium]|nr:hypothetical protein [Clostridium tertium]